MRTSRSEKRTCAFNVPFYHTSYPFDAKPECIRDHQELLRGDLLHVASNIFRTRRAEVLRASLEKPELGTEGRGACGRVR